MTQPVVPTGRLRERAQPQLAAGGLVLRPWRPADAGPLVEAYGDPGIQRWHVRSMTEAEAVEWIAERERRWLAEAGVDWAVVERGDVVGRVGFGSLQPAEGRGEAAFWVMPDARGRGVAVRALGAATAWMLGDAGFHRLELRHSTHNQASCRVAEKAGYRFEGIQRQHGLHADGWHDMHLHARLRTDAECA
jgi:[ribosomal protein S5]-alanine N-acetyltransferase